MKRSVAIVLVVLSVTVRAAYGQEEQRADTATVTLTPYAWLPASLTGDITLGRQSVVLNADMADLLKRLELAGAIHGELWRGSVGFVADFMYARFGDERMTQVGELDVDLTELLGAAAFAYRFGQWCTSELEDSIRVSAFVYAGARITRFKTELSIADSSVEDARTLIDPMIGIRIPVQLSRAWRFGASADVGGFGVDSDIIWNVVFGFSGAVSSTVSLQFGYRIMSVAFDEQVGTADEVLVRTTTHGPDLAVTFAF